MSKSLEAADPPLVMNDDWKHLVGKNVSIRLREATVDSGRVDAVTNDGEVLWLEACGAAGRRLFVRTDGYEIWSEPELPDAGWPDRCRQAGSEPMMKSIPFELYFQGPPEF